MTVYDPRKPKPWPIQLLNKWGVTNDSLATRIVLIFSSVIILFSVYSFLRVATHSENLHELSEVEKLEIKAEQQLELLEQ